MLDWLILVAQAQSVWLGYDFFPRLMLTLYQCKPAFQNLLRPLVDQLATWQISPNHVTVSTILLCGATGLAIAYFPQSQFVFLLLPIVLLGRMALNAIDGMLAREHCLTTHLGCILNELGDVISDVALYLPLSLIPGIAAPPIVGIVILGIITEMVGVLGLAITDKRCTVEGLFGGVLVTTGLAIALAPWLTPFDLLHAVCIGLLLSLTGFIGDVSISAFKRDLGIKDSGTLLPGHGGILDRIDSLTYTAPLFFHFTVYFYYRGQLL